ncbi:MAG: TonB-dependent receptor [Lentimicrobiaceae bacterium]|jgi:hemoglobin/transferrin/lactoferrin receptor protein|nr:TonB-dependent receptor [Lentimicrobiaceae bacterium]MBT3454749.1 TonB-dependent receptor [Lentimicrobiaceae bacterium]MBT3819647.1 TonB-dependent receptor [Lentimicrobiaceae bacterium]MBT4191434.1 TonB-dependent receptor [Lentimicrobiaceae bacterium]MBT4467220.1 TonB-dependent receptor [Lentimicrobiaceae bacterium]
MKLGKSIFLGFILLIISDVCSGQNIFIYNQQTGNPVSNVALYNTDKSLTSISNDIGIANIDVFGSTEEVIFQHPSFNLLIIDKGSIAKLNYKVPLNEKLINLDEVIVSASRWETKANEIPNKIEKIKQQDIVFNNPATSADMIASGNEVYVQKSQLGGGSPMIRGFAANKILFIVDGVRMNNAIYRSGNLHNVLQADVNSLESAEIIFGPGTNIYGSDALGGVIDFHTLNPRFSLEEKVTTTGSAFARISSADFEKTLSANINISNNRWALLTNISYGKFDDLRMGGMHNDYNLRNKYVAVIDGNDSIINNDNPEIQKFSGYDQTNFITKLGHKFNENIDWVYGLYLTRASAVPRYDRLLQESNNQLKYAVWNYEPQQWLMNNLMINIHNNASWYDNAVFILAYQNVKEGRNDRKFKNDWLRKRKEQVNIFSINADFDKTLSNGNFLYYGIELTYNKVDSDGIEENIKTNETNLISSRYPDGGTNFFQTGAYLSYKKNFQNIPATFLTGARYSFVSLDSKFNDTTFYNLPYDEIDINNSAVTGNVGFVYHPGDWQFNINISSGFRAPNLDDVGKIFDSEPGNVVVPNENLKPEYLYNLDVGIIRKYDDWAKIEITGFYSYLIDAMVRRDYLINGKDSIIYDGELSKVQAIVNTGSAVIYGASIIAELKIFPHLLFKSVLTATYGKDSDGETLRHAPPLFGSTSLTFERSKFKVMIGARYNGQIDFDQLAPGERDKEFLYAKDKNGNPYSPAWWTLNLKGSYAFNNNFLTTFGVDNILNYRYRTYSSGITSPGRNFIIAFKYLF